jgi:hypothetical protein
MQEWNSEVYFGNIKQGGSWLFTLNENKGEL